jgi:hypothetical protein
VEGSGLGCADCHPGERHPPAANTAPASCALCHK